MEIQSSFVDGSFVLWLRSKTSDINIVGKVEEIIPSRTHDTKETKARIKNILRVPPVRQFLIHLTSGDEKKKKRDEWGVGEDCLWDVNLLSVWMGCTAKNIPAISEKFLLKPATFEQILVNNIDERIWRITLTMWNQKALSIPKRNLLSLTSVRDTIEREKLSRDRWNAKWWLNGGSYVRRELPEC